jgi:tetratricopeptide (TPR) repeat protein
VKVKSVYVGDFWGDGERSPSGEFTVAHGILLGGKEAADRHFVLLRRERSMFRRERERLIYRGTLGGQLVIDSVTVDDAGNFCLQTYIIGGGRGQTLLFFHATGEQYASIFVHQHAYFVQLEQNGAHVLFATTEKVFLLNVLPTHTVAAFDLPRHFYARQGTVDYAARRIYLTDSNVGQSYSFDFAGKFLDEERWFRDFVARAKPQSVYYAVRDRYLRADDWTPEQYREAANQIEIALGRGIEDSFHLKRADVLTFLGVLRRLAGGEARAAQAATAAEAVMDGFRFVDSIDRRIDEIIREADGAAIRQQLQQLTNAETYPRLDHYPNYFGRLFKLKGSLFLALGERENAIAAFRRALEINPRVGCKRMLQSLENQS